MTLNRLVILLSLFVFAGMVGNLRSCQETQEMINDTESVVLPENITGAY